MYFFEIKNPDSYFEKFINCMIEIVTTSRNLEFSNRKGTF